MNILWMNNAERIHFPSSVGRTLLMICDYGSSPAGRRRINCSARRFAAPPEIRRNPNGDRRIGADA
jgi:hypothetical protein